MSSLGLGFSVGGMDTMRGNLLLSQDFGNAVIEIRKTTWPVGGWGQGEQTSLVSCKPRETLAKQEQWGPHTPSAFKHLS